MSTSCKHSDTLRLSQTATPQLLDYGSSEEEDGEVGLRDRAGNPCESTYRVSQVVAKESETEAEEGAEEQTMSHPFMGTVVKVFGRVTRDAKPTGTTYQLQAHAVRPVSERAEYDCHLLQAVLHDELCIHGRYMVRCRICTPMEMDTY